MFWCRTETKLPKKIKAKLAQFVNVPAENVIESIGCENDLGSARNYKTKFDEGF